MSEIRLTGPDMCGLINEAVLTWRNVMFGEWAWVVYHLFPDNWEDPEAASAAFTQLAAATMAKNTPAATADFDPPVYDDVTERPDVVIWQSERGLLMQALELYMRLCMGQFGMMSEVATGWVDVEHANSVRNAYQRPDAWPQGLNAAWSIASPKVGRPAQRAYDLWQLLGGGLGRGLLTHEVAVSE